MAALTMQFVHESESYRALGPHGREAADAALASATAELGRLGPGAVTAVKLQFVAGYKAGVDMLMVGGWLTPAQATLLAAYADAL